MEYRGEWGGGVKVKREERQDESWREFPNRWSFASFCRQRWRVPRCVASRSSEKKKEGGKVTGFGIRTSVVTLELFRDLHASVFGYVEDEGIVEEKFLACLSFSV